MNRYKLIKAGVDYNDGVMRFGGSREMYEKLLAMFIDDTNYSALLSAVDAKDVNACFTAAHSLKGVAGNLSLTDLYNAVVPLVEVFRAGSMDGYDKYLPAITAAYTAAYDEIKAQLSAQQTQEA